MTDRTRIRCEDEHSPDITQFHRGDDNGSGANCTAADLIVGAVVDHAELELEHGSATFDELDD